MRWSWIVPGLVGVLFLGCASTPVGPTVLVLPGAGKPFDQFQADDAACRSWATQQAGGVTPGEAAAGSVAASAALGTVAGAAVGAVIGAATGSPAAGAAIGAGGGLLTGGVVGAGAGQWSGREVQRHYDVAYIQCMYGRGNRVPVPGGLAASPVPPPPPSPPR
jgi:hypothetical protein